MALSDILTKEEIEVLDLISKMTPNYFDDEEIDENEY